MKDTRKARFVRRSMKHRACKTAGYGYLSDTAVDDIYEYLSSEFYDALARNDKVDIVSVLDSAEENGVIRYWQDETYPYLDDALADVLGDVDNAIRSALYDAAYNAASDFVDEFLPKLDSELMREVSQKMVEDVGEDMRDGTPYSKRDIESLVEDELYRLVDGYEPSNIDDIVEDIVSELEGKGLEFEGARRMRATMKNKRAYIDDNVRLAIWEYAKDLIDAEVPSEYIDLYNEHNDDYEMEDVFSDAEDAIMDAMIGALEAAGEEEAEKQGEILIETIDRLYEENGWERVARRRFAAAPSDSVRDRYMRLRS